MLNCAIIDDEPLAREILVEYMNRLPDINLVGSFNNAIDARIFLIENAVDALFLDIEMPEMNGITFLQSLPHPPITVFTTAFRNYAFEGFELGVIDFLLKPISFPRFLTSLEKIKDFISLKAQPTDFEIMTDEPSFIFVKSGVLKLKLFFADVTHVQGLKDYAIIHTTSTKIVAKGSVKSMQLLFPPPRFIRVHKSFIVAKDKIQRIEKNRIILGDHQIPIGRNYKADMEREISSL